MCGIVGVISKHKNGFYSPVDEIFEEMLLADAVRGMDSTGVFMVDEKNRIDCVKQAVNPGIFMTTTSWKQWRSKIISNGRVIVGHNRKATMGEVISQNAHPFVATMKDHNIALVHNGFISNWRQFDDKANVDSAAVATALLEKSNPLDVIKELSGAYALVWYDHKKRKLFITRNKERPLFLQHTNDYMFFASEEGMLKWVLERDGRAAKANPMEFGVNKLYEISVHGYEFKTHDVPRWSPLPTNDMRNHMMGYPGDLSGNTPVDDTDDEIPLPELERAKKMAEQEANKGSTEELEQRAKELQKLYPFGARVLFMPIGMDPDCITMTDGKKHHFYRVRGNIFQPGKPAMPARTTVPDDKMDMFIAPEIPLYSRVDSIVRRNSEVWFTIGDSRQQTVIVKDVNGRPVGREEWSMICDTVGCDECAKPLRPHQGIEYSSIVRTSKPDYSVICADCIGKQTEPKHGGANGG